MARLLERFFAARRGRSDLARARREVPHFADFEKAIPRWKNELSPLWDRYTRTVSTPDMAVALEIAAILGALIETVRPANVLDLGSGFSSFVTRTATARHGGGKVKSVDDDAAWLEKTREFLRAEGVQTGDVCDLSGLGPAEKGRYDIVFHDIGSMETRKKLLPSAIEYARPGGLVLIDDCHKRKYLTVVDDELKRRGLAHYSLRALGCDRFHRYDILAVRSV